MMININTVRILPENSPQTTRSYGPIQSVEKKNQEEKYKRHINYMIAKDLMNYMLKSQTSHKK